jgi:hypothetical protein
MPDLPIGTIASIHRGKLKGVITARKGDAEGRQAYFVSSFSLLPQGYWASEHELEVEDAPTFPIGKRVKVHGQDGEIVGPNPDGSYVFLAEITLPKTGLVRAVHVYPAVRAGDILRWNL